MEAPGPDGAYTAHGPDLGWASITVCGELVSPQHCNCQTYIERCLFSTEAAPLTKKQLESLFVPKRRRPHSAMQKCGATAEERRP